MQVRRSLAIGLTAASLALAAIGGVSASAAPQQSATIPSEVRDIVIGTPGLSSLETIIPTGLPNTLPVATDGPVGGPDARS